MLGELDLVVAAVHSKFNLSREKQTERILRAMERPHFTILAHPTGRLIGEREPYDVDMPRIIRAASGRGCFLELNAHPDRLDLTDMHCRMAKEAGVLVSIATDAHPHRAISPILRFGVGQARRGWLGPAGRAEHQAVARAAVFTAADDDLASWARPPWRNRKACF